MDKIKREKLLNLLIILYGNYEYLDDTPKFFGLSSKERALICISEIICLISNEDFGKFVNSIKDVYRYLYLNKSIIYWLNSKKKNNEEFDYDRLNIFETIYNQQISSIKLNKINIYSNENYAMHNHIYLLDDSNYVQFIKDNIDDDFLPLFIIDSLTISTGTKGFGYEFHPNKIEQICSIEYAKSVLTKINHPTTEFLLKVLNSKPAHMFEKENIYYTQEWNSLVELSYTYLDFIKKN